MPSIIIHVPVCTHTKKKKKKETLEQLALSMSLMISLRQISRDCICGPGVSFLKAEAVPA